MPDPTTYLVTGANRGIGLGLTTTLLARPNTNVIAAVRNPDTSAKVFADIEAAENSKISVIRIDASIPSDAQAAISQLRDQAELEKIDVVIANAAIADHYGPVADIKLDEVMRHFAVNVVGQIALFQATLPLLEKSENAKFVGIASLAGSIGDMEKFPMPCLAYGTSKAGLNYFLRKAHFENEKITIYALNPGWVQTDMGNAGAAVAGLESAPVTIDDSVKGILKNIDKATKQKTSGTFQSYNDNQFAW